MDEDNIIFGKKIIFIDSDRWSIMQSLSMDDSGNTCVNLSLYKNGRITNDKKLPEEIINKVEQLRLEFINKIITSLNPSAE